MLLRSAYEEAQRCSAWAAAIADLEHPEGKAAKCGTMRASPCTASAVRNPAAYGSDQNRDAWGLYASDIEQSSVETSVAKRLTKSQSVAMNWLAQGWKAYSAGGTRVEVNGNPVCTTATMDSLEKLGLAQKLGVAAWEATEAGKQWRAQRESQS
ncbi:MAG: hypothetical protein WC809_10870 [Sinimarinibacterium sp.]